jgi:phosphoserine phosphatase RsbU/P
VTAEIGLPQGEQRRLESLRRLDVLDVPAGEEHTDIVTLVGRLVEAPFAAITFVDADRAWSGAVVGVSGPVEVQRSASPAVRAIAGGEQVVEVDLTGRPSPSIR